MMTTDHSTPNGCRRSRVAVLVAVAFVATSLSGCYGHEYLVDRRVTQRAIAVPPTERRNFMVPAKRISDGRKVFLRMDSVDWTSVPGEGAPVPVYAESPDYLGG